MSHMVIYRGADGKPGYHQTDDIHDAVMYVESLRNDKDVDHARIFRLEEVTFEYKPYYRVEINAGGAAPAAVGTSNGSSGSESLAAADSDDGDDDEDVDTSEAATDEVADSADEDAVETDDGSDDSSNGDDEPVSARRGLFGR